MSSPACEGQDSPQFRKQTIISSILQDRLLNRDQMLGLQAMRSKEGTVSNPRSRCTEPMDIKESLTFSPRFGAAGKQLGAKNVRIEWE